MLRQIQRLRLRSISNKQQRFQKESESKQIHVAFDKKNLVKLNYFINHKPDSPAVVICFYYFKASDVNSIYVTEV
jgi:hypothetical protein